MIKYTTYTQKKIENLFKVLEFTLRYEKGSFQSGYCIVEKRNIIVINRFFDVEAKINCMIDILSTLEVDETVFDEKDQKLFRTLLKKASEKDGDSEEEETESKESPKQ